MPRKRDKNKFRRGGSQRYMRYAHAVSPKRRTTHTMHSFSMLPLLVSAFAVGAVAMAVITIPYVKIPTISIPDIHVQAPTIPSLPTITIPKITAPEISVPTVSLPKMSVPTPPKLSLPRINLEWIGIVSSRIRIISLASIAIGRNVALITTSIAVNATVATWRLQTTTINWILLGLVTAGRMLSIGLVIVLRALYTFLLGFIQFLVSIIVQLVNLVVGAFRFIVNGVISISQAIYGFFQAVGARIQETNQKINQSADATGKFFEPYIVFIVARIQGAIDYFVSGLKDMNHLVGELANEYNENTK